MSKRPAGKTALPIQNYHIPLIIFAPGGHVAPGRVRTLTSQIDYGPTLIGPLNQVWPQFEGCPGRPA